VSLIFPLRVEVAAIYLIPPGAKAHLNPVACELMEDLSPGFQLVEMPLGRLLCGNRGPVRNSQRRERRVTPPQARERKRHCPLTARGRASENDAAISATPTIASG
jgi:hypothetical protein